MNTHELKINPVHYNNVKAGTKTFEIRKNDRVFQKGDNVILYYWPELADRSDKIKSYSNINKPMYFKIGDVYPIQDDYVVFSLLSNENESNRY